MSFWEWLSEFAARQAKRSADRKVKYVPLAGFHNRMDAFSGELSTMMNLAGSIINQHISTCMSDFGGIVSQNFVEAYDKLQVWLDQTFKLYENSVQHIIGTFNSACEVRHQEAQSLEQRNHNKLFESIMGLWKHIQSHEFGENHRYNTMCDRMDTLERKRERDLDVMLATMAAMQDNVMTAVMQKQRVVTEYKVQPTVEWILDHSDELIRLCSALKGMQNNDYPVQHAITDAIKCFRAMMPCEMSIFAIKDALEERATQWGLLEVNRLAA